MTRSARILAGVSLGYVQLVVTTVVAIWFTPFLLRHIGDHDFGIWSAALPVLMYVGYAEFGLLTLLQRDVGYALGKAGGDAAAAPDLADCVGKSLRILLMLIPLFVTASIAMWAGLSHGWGNARAAFALVLLALILSFPLRVGHAALTGLQDLAFLGRLSLFNYLAGIALSVALVWLGWGLFGLAASWAFTQLFVAAVCLVRLRLKFPTAVPRRLTPVTRAEVREQLGAGFWIVATQLSSVMVNSFDVIVIAAMLGADAVVPYTITDRLLTMFGNLTLQINVAAQPALTELRTSKERHRLADVCAALLQTSLLSTGLVLTLVVFVNQGFITWWVGAHDFAGPYVSLLLALGALACLWFGTTNYALFAFGYEKRILVSTGLSGAVTVGLGVWLTHVVGLAGPPIGMIVGSGLLGIPLNLNWLARETGTTVKAQLRGLLPWAWRFALVLGTGFVVGHRWPPTTFLSLAAASIGSVLLYGAVMFPLVLRHPVGMYVRPRLERLRVRFAR